MRNRRLNDWINSYIEYTDLDEPPYMYKLWCAISILSAVLQRKCTLPWGTLSFYPKMYVVLVGPSGRARKGTAMAPALNLLMDLRDGEYNIHLAAEATTREALIVTLEKASHNEIDINTGAMNFHSSLTIFSPELTVFLGYQNYQLMSDLTDWFDCRRQWTYQTKNVGTNEIFGVYVTLLGATTPDLIRTTLPLDAIGGGLTSRIIFVYEENPDKCSPAPFLTPKIHELKKDLFHDLEQIHALNGDFRYTEDFLSRWIDWYTAQDANPPMLDHRFGGYIARRPMHIMKLSMIVNASRTDKMVLDIVDLERAIQILDRTEINMGQTFGGMGLYSHSELVPKVMVDVANKGKMGITLSELQDRYKFDVAPRTLHEILEILETSKFLRVVDDRIEVRYVHAKSLDE